MSGNFHLQNHANNGVFDSLSAGVVPPDQRVAQTFKPKRMETPGYEPLGRVLQHAFDQSATGKGRERHGNGKPFIEQPIMEIGRMVGIGYQVGQVMKKAQEAATMASRGNHTGAQAELLGVIVYAAAAFILSEEQTARATKADA